MDFYDAEVDPIYETTNVAEYADDNDSDKKEQHIDNEEESNAEADTAMTIDADKSAEDKEATMQKRQGRRVIVLCGLVGSGKSSFATSLQKHFPRYVRCNQDQLGSRQKVQMAAEAALRARVAAAGVESMESADSNGAAASTSANGPAEPRAFADKVAVIDRTNVDESHRKPWIEMADQFGVEAEAMVFDTPLDVCRERLLVRKDHETLKDPQRALDVLARFERDFRPPTHAEGFRRIIHVHPKDMTSGPDMSLEEVVALLDRLANAETIDAPRSTSISSGGSRRGARAPSGPRRGSPYARRPPAPPMPPPHMQPHHHLAYGAGAPPFGYPQPGFGFPPQFHPHGPAAPFPIPGQPPHAAPPMPYHIGPAYAQGPWRGPGAGRGAPFHQQHQPQYPHYQRGARPPPSAPHGPAMSRGSVPQGTPRGPARANIHAPTVNGDYRNTGPTRGARTLN